jgi:hypothetical protein
MKLQRSILSGLVLLLTGCLIGPDRVPHAVLPPIAEEYYVCAKCGSLHGGIYGKGPLEYFRTPRADGCWHKWRQISKEEFQKKKEGGIPDRWLQSTHIFKLSAKTENNFRFEVRH